MAGKFEPKVPVNLHPPKDDAISPAELAKADGTSSCRRRRLCVWEPNDSTTALFTALFIALSLTSTSLTWTSRVLT